MPKYLFLFSYSSDSVKAMVKSPSDRSAAAKALVESLGGTQEAFYWMHGQHDGFLIADLPDGVAASALSVAVGAAGAIVDAETHEIFGHDDQTAIVTKADAALKAYKAPAG